MSTKFQNKMTDLFYDLPLWLQIYTQIEKETFIRGLLRRTSKGLNDKCLLIKDDFDYANSQLRISWYRINKDYVLIADDSEEGNRVYNYYFTINESAQLFLKTKQN
jgi:hypothetical protein